MSEDDRFAIFDENGLCPGHFERKLKGRQVLVANEIDSAQKFMAQIDPGIREMDLAVLDQEKVVYPGVGKIPQQASPNDQLLRAESSSYD